MEIKLRLFLARRYTIEPRKIRTWGGLTGKENT